MLEPVQFFSDDPFQDRNQEVKNKTVRLQIGDFLQLAVVLVVGAFSLYQGGI